MKENIKLPNNPFKYCMYYRNTKPDKNGVICCHVDGPLCNVNVCEKNAPFKKSMYFKKLARQMDTQLILMMSLLIFVISLTSGLMLVNDNPLSYVMLLTTIPPMWFISTTVEGWS